MTIKWLREQDIDELVLLVRLENWIADKHQLMTIYKRFPHLCYGAYDGDFFVGAIMGYTHLHSAWINNFFVKSNYRKQGVGKRLFKTLLRALELEEKVIYLVANQEVEKFYSSFGFNRVIEIGRVFRESKEINFKFNSNYAKELQKDSFKLIYTLDNQIYKDDRTTYLKEDLIAHSSLILATQNGFLHSKMVFSSLFIGPFLVKVGAYMDAERLLRGVLYKRGLKNIYADIPLHSKEMENLYKHYGFSIINRTSLMVLGDGLKINFDAIYGFGSAGICG